MSIYLNTDKSLLNYKKLYRSKYFVDKSLIIEKLNELMTIIKGSTLCCTLLYDGSIAY